MTSENEIVIQLGGQFVIFTDDTTKFDFVEDQFIVTGRFEVFRLKHHDQAVNTSRFQKKKALRRVLHTALSYAEKTVFPVADKFGIDRKSLFGQL